MGPEESVNYSSKKVQIINNEIKVKSKDSQEGKEIKIIKKSHQQ